MTWCHMDTNVRKLFTPCHVPWCHVPFCLWRLLVEQPPRLQFRVPRTQTRLKLAPAAMHCVFRLCKEFKSWNTVCMIDQTHPVPPEYSRYMVCRLCLNLRCRSTQDTFYGPGRYQGFSCAQAHQDTGNAAAAVPTVRSCSSLWLLLRMMTLMMMQGRVKCTQTFR